MSALIKDDVVIVGLLLAVPGLAVFLAKKYKCASYISAAGLCYIFGILLSNVHVLPPEHSAYDFFSTYGLYTALSLILLTIDLRSVVKLARNSAITLLTCFAVVFVVAVLSGLYFAPRISAEHGWKITAMLIGTYTGGSMNLVATGKALGVPNELFIATNAADIVFGTIFLPIQLILIPLVSRWKIPKLTEDEVQVAEGEVAEKVKNEGYWYKKSWNYYDLVYSVSIAAAIMAVSHLISAAFNFGIWSGTVNILLLTTFSLLLGSTKLVRNLVGGEEVGMYLIHVFLFSLGLTCYVPILLKAPLAIVWWVVITIYVSALLDFLISAYVFKVDYQSIWVQAQASIGGPPTAMSLAIAAGWPALVLPGALGGLIGYAAGNYLGFAGAALVKMFLH